MLMKAMPLSKEALDAVSKGLMPPQLKFRVVPSMGTLLVKALFPSLPFSIVSVSLSLQQTLFFLEICFSADEALLLSFAGKLDIKNYLKSIYGLDIKRVHTANYQGKKKALRLRNKIVYYRRPDYKSVTVELNQPPPAQK